MTFGERLRQLRDARGLSVGALAQAVGVTEGAIRQMESGQTKQASFAVGVRLARVLGVSPESLAGEEGEDETPRLALMQPDPNVAARLFDDVVDLRLDMKQVQAELAAANLRLAELAEEVSALKAAPRRPSTRRQSS